MTEILLILLLTLLLFAAVLWSVKKLADLWEAERTGYGQAAVAIGASIIISLLLPLFLSTVFSPLVLTIAGLAIDAWIFSFLLGLSLLRGLGVTIITNIIAIVLIVLAALLLSTLGMGGRMLTDSMEMFADEQQQRDSLKAYADAVCYCGRDETCRSLWPMRSGCRWTGRRLTSRPWHLGSATSKISSMECASLRGYFDRGAP